jgi:hypothetical protein
MSKKFLSLFLLTLMLFSSLASVSAFMPRNTHRLIFEESVAEPIDSEFYRACMKYPNLCYTGNVLADISVIWYWTEGYKYAVTHSPNFCRNLIESATNDQEYACAVGGCSHQPADIVSHNELVPYSIEHSFLANVVIHVFTEQKVDNWVVRNYPDIQEFADEAMSDYEVCMPLFKRVMLGYEEYGDITEEEVNAKFDKFIQEIKTSQTGYDTAYQNKGIAVNLKAIPFAVIAAFIIFMVFWFLLVMLLIIKLIKGDRRLRVWLGLIIFGALLALFLYIFVMNLQGAAFKAIITIAKPVSELVPIGNTPEYYIDKATVNTRALLLQGQSWLTDSEASGFTALEASDRQILMWDYVFLLALTVALGLFIYFIFKTNPLKSKYSYKSSKSGYSSTLPNI